MNMLLSIDNIDLLLFFPCPPVREVCPNYEVVMFQSRIGTPLDLGSLDNFYVDILVITDPNFSNRNLMCARGGYLLMPPSTLPYRPSCLQTGSFAHPGVTCLCPSIPQPVATCISLRYLPAPSALATPEGLPTPRP